MRDKHLASHGRSAADGKHKRELRLVFDISFSSFGLLFCVLFKYINVLHISVSLNLVHVIPVSQGPLLELCGALEFSCIDIRMSLCHFAT